MLKKKITINCKGNLIDFKIPKIMGILNITPDSFFDGGKHNSISKAVEQTRKMLSKGADFIDIGAVSSRPGADLLNFEEEKHRLEPIVKTLTKEFPDVIFSLDTFRAKIAEYFVHEYDIAIINDISAGKFDNKMFETVAKLKVPYVMMHMKGEPDNMQHNPQYNDIIQEMTLYFADKLLKLKLLGVNDVIIDPGFGFGKTIDHNYELLKRLKELKIFELPILVGISRKSMIYKQLDTTPENALYGTIAANAFALINGANILRVHDVKAAKDTISIVFAKLESNNFSLLKL